MLFIRNAWVDAKFQKKKCVFDCAFKNEKEIKEKEEYGNI